MRGLDPLSRDGKAWHCPKQPKFLFPVRALGSLFRCKVLARLATMLKAGELDLPDSQLQIAATGAGWLSALSLTRDAFLRMSQSRSSVSAGKNLSRAAAKL